MDQPYVPGITLYIIFLISGASQPDPAGNDPFMVCEIVIWATFPTYCLNEALRFKKNCVSAHWSFPEVNEFQEATSQMITNLLRAFSLMV